jgi:RHS repeat-associated protein
MTGATGSQLNSAFYDSFGDLTVSTGSFGNPFQYTGRDFDPETGLRYYRARYYDPATGRFLSEDLIRFQSEDVNLYSYVANNSINFIDPKGLSRECPVPRLCGDTAMSKPKDKRDEAVEHLGVFDAAFDAQIRHFPFDPDPYGGGHRHCMAACLLKRRWGLIGVAIRKARDVISEDDSADSLSDIKAEHIGEDTCASKAGSCEMECLKFYPELPSLLGPKFDPNRKPRPRPRPR